MEPVRFVTIGTRTLLREFCEKADHLVIDDRGLHLPEQACYEPAGILFAQPGLDLRDVAVDTCGTPYLLDGDGTIYVQDACRGPFAPLGCPPETLPVPLADPHALDLDRNTLYIGDGNRVLALSRRNLQVRWILDRAPDGTALGTIADLALDRKGRMFLLEEERVLILDRGSRMRGQVSLRETATDLAAVPGGGLAVLGPGFLITITQEEIEEAIADSTPVTPQHRLDIDVGTATGLAPAGEATYIIGEGASPTHASPAPATGLYRVQGDSPGASLLRVTSYRGLTRRLVSDRSGNLYLIAGEGDALYLVRHVDPATMRCPLPDSAGVFTGTYQSRVIDSRSRDTRWHRFVIDGTFPAGTGAGFEYAVSNDEFPGVWHEGLPGPSAGQGERKRDGLFLRGEKGRYLWFRVRLYGTSALSPEVSRITVYFPRSTYIEVLPAIYQEDEVSSDFLERFLSLFESTWAEVDDEIDHLTRYLDPGGTPSEFLPWLGSWVALSMDGAWPEEMRRWLIRNAIQLYKARGTPAGLVEVIESYLHAQLKGGRAFIIENLPQPCPITSERCGRCPDRTGAAGADADGARAVEPPTGKRCWEQGPVQADPRHGCLFYPPAGVKPAPCEVQASRWSVAEREMTLSQILFGGSLFCFCVLIANAEPGEDELTAVRRIVEAWKPAHTCCSLKVLPPGIALDGLTFLGVNTTLAGPGVVIGQSVLGRGTVLTDPGEGGRVAPPSKIGIDSRLS